MTHLYVWHVPFICVTWPTYMCDMTHSYVWHDSFICVTWLVNMHDVTHVYVWHDSFIYDVTHLYVWHDPSICVTWLINVYEMTRSHVWHDSFICVTQIIYMCGITHVYVWHNSFLCATWHLRFPVERYMSRAERETSHTHTSREIYVTCREGDITHISQQQRHHIYLSEIETSHTSLTWKSVICVMSQIYVMEICNMCNIEGCVLCAETEIIHICLTETSHIPLRDRDISHISYL